MASWEYFLIFLLLALQRPKNTLGPEMNLRISALLCLLRSFPTICLQFYFPFCAPSLNKWHGSKVATENLNVIFFGCQFWWFLSFSTILTPPRWIGTLSLRPIDWTSYITLQFTHSLEAGRHHSSWFASNSLLTGFPAWDLLSPGRSHF